MRVNRIGQRIRATGANETMSWLVVHWRTILLRGLRLGVVVSATISVSGVPILQNNIAVMAENLNGTQERKFESSGTGPFVTELNNVAVYENEIDGNTTFQGQGTAKAVSDFGSLGVYLESSELTSSYVGCQASAEFRDNFLILGPAGGPVPVVVRLSVSGKLIAGFNDPDGTAGNAGLAVWATYRGISRVNSRLALYRVNNGSVMEVSEALTFQFMAPVGQSFELSLHIDASTLGGHVDFLNTVEIDALNPFLLPDGYSIISEAGTPTGPSSVPDGGATSMLLSVSLAFVYAYQRRDAGTKAARSCSTYSA